MVAFELVRLVLFAVEAALSIAALAIFPSHLYRTTLGADTETVCAIGSPSLCRFGIAWTLLGTIFLLAVIAWHLSGASSRAARFPPRASLLAPAFSATTTDVSSLSTHLQNTAPVSRCQRS
jgi:hypothetical protein